MNLKLKVKLVGSSSDMARKIGFLSQGGKERILRALGAKFKYLTVQNLGFSGKDRPSDWAPLSKPYAKRVKRPVATLELTGRLLRSLSVSAPEGDSITVSSNTDYDRAQQYGNPDRNLPARPFFPVFPNGDATPLTQRILETTASLEIQKLIRERLQ